MFKLKGHPVIFNLPIGFKMVTSGCRLGRYVLICLMIITVSPGCELRNQAEKPLVPALQAEDESKSVEQIVVLQKDTNAGSAIDTTAIGIDTPRNRIAKEKPAAKRAEKTATDAKADDGAERHYYKGGKLSVRIDPWDENQHRKIHFYNRNREETFTMEDVRQSYSVLTELSFHDNGAVRVAETSINPGGSMYWHEQKITFDEDNYPLQRFSQRMPADHLQSTATTTKPDAWNRLKKMWE